MGDSEISISPVKQEDNYAIHSLITNGLFSLVVSSPLVFFIISRKHHCYFLDAQVIKIPQEMKSGGDVEEGLSPPGVAPVASHYDILHEWAGPLF